MFRRRRPLPPLAILAAVAAVAGLSIAAAREASSASVEVAPAVSQPGQGPAEVAVRAPVDGEVVDVRDYYLYGKHRDQRVEIVPAANPDLRLVMIHVDGVAVETGDVLVAGETVVAAQARRFGFSSHIDRYTEPDRHGHVHLEVKPATVAQPGEETVAAGDDG